MENQTVLKDILETKPFFSGMDISVSEAPSGGFFHLQVPNKDKDDIDTYDLNTDNEDALLVAASFLANRSVEVEKTTDGKYIVLYMRFEKSPPPKEDTSIEALRSFIRMMLQRNQEVGTMIADGHKKGENNANRTGHSSGPDQEDQSS